MKTKLEKAELFHAERTDKHDEAFHNSVTMTNKAEIM
jgi:hypothetical protein